MNSFSLQLLQISLWHPRRGTILLLGQYPPKRGSSLPLFRRRTPILLPDRQLQRWAPEFVFRRELKPAAQGKAQYPHPGAHCPAFSITQSESPAQPGDEN